MLAVCGWALLSACSSTSNLHDAPPASAATGSGAGGASSGNTGAASGAATSGTSGGATGAASDAGANVDGTVGDGAAASDAAAAEGGEGDAAATGDGETSDSAADTGAPAPRCEPTQTWSNHTSVPTIPTANFDRFGGVSGDELALAWTSTSGNSFIVNIANRASLLDGFAMPTTINPGAALLANDRVALASNGVTLIAVVADRSTFVGFNFSGTTGDWTPLPAAQFANLAGMVAESGGMFSEPVLGGDGLSLFFLLTLPGAAPVLVESRWDAANQQWAPGTGFTDAELASTDATHRRRPTGASSDGLTLFYYDEIGATERAAFRTSIGDTFVPSIALLGLNEAAPTVLCDKLYFVADVNGQAMFEAE